MFFPGRILPARCSSWICARRRSWGLASLFLCFFFVDLFDNVGTLVGVCEEGGFLRDGKLPRASRALLADAIGTIVGALRRHVHGDELRRERGGRCRRRANRPRQCGDCGVIRGRDVLRAAGGRDSVLRTAPALILVGALMCGAVARVKWDDFTDAVPAFLTLIATPLTFSIATGLEPGNAFLHFPEAVYRAAQGDQPADLGAERLVSAALRVPRRGIDEGCQYGSLLGCRSQVRKVSSASSRII